MKRHESAFLFAAFVSAASFLFGCGSNGSGSEDDPELAEWNGTWNSIIDYFDAPKLAKILEDQYEAMKGNLGEMTLEGFIAYVKEISLTDFGSFAVQGDKIIFYDQRQLEKNPSGTIIDVVTYTYKGVRQVTWQGETADFYAFESDNAGDYKYLIFEEAERDTADGPLHFHMRYGSESIDSLVNLAALWAPTIVSYDTTIAELQVFMSGD